MNVETIVRTGEIEAAILLAIITMAVFAPLLAPYPPDQQSDLINTPPCDGAVTCMAAWLHLAKHSHWLSAVAGCSP